MRTHLKHKLGPWKKPLIGEVEHDTDEPIWIPEIPPVPKDILDQSRKLIRQLIQKELERILKGVDLTSSGKQS